MPVSDKTHYNLPRMHAVFALAALALLAATVWMVVADSRRPWKEYQRQYRLLTGQPPRSPTIEQIWLPDLTIDYKFHQVARFDRCTTCHLGINQASASTTVKKGTGSEPTEANAANNGQSEVPVPFFTSDAALPQPYRPHPRLDLFVGARSPHPASEFGCTICHDGQGSATDFRWASHTPNDRQQRRQWQTGLGWSANPHWDFPMLASRFLESRCLQCHPNVAELQSPSADSPTSKLVAGYQLVRQLGCFGCHEIPTFQNVADKVGPSLRNIAGKFRPDYLVDRIRNPANFLPATRMPRQFGLHEHLAGQTLTCTTQSEELELQAVADYLLATALSVDPAPQPPGVTESPSPERGKRLFATQGCLACHQHQDFPQGQATQGPNLSNVGAKYAAQTGADWLTGWLRDPACYSPQTLMPNPVLEPTPLADSQQMTDPATDLAAYLVGDGKQGTNNEQKAEGERRKAKEVAGSASTLAQSLIPNPQSPSLGRRAIAKRGCYACHDIPGFEVAQPIGPSLANWGRKPESQLAFEHIDDFVKNVLQASNSATKPGTRDSDGFLLDALLSHRREGFLWQKLCMPRSFDYKLAEHKPLDEQLKMGRFELSESQREAIITFILGLTDEAPPAKYVYRPSPTRKTILEGRKVLDKYACAACHTLTLEQWTLDDSRKLLGMPRLSAAGAVLEEEDDDGNPVCFFTLWEPAGQGGREKVGGPDVVVPKNHLAAVQPPWGGTLARLLYPLVLAEARQSGSSAAEVEAWGWLPPALVHEGAIVQPDWLFRYLLEPTVIRPAAVLRMPRFNLSSAEAAKLTDYFAATAGVEFPYTAKPIAASAPLDPERLDNAQKLLVDRTTFCGKCHATGDDAPAERNRTLLAPRLDEVGRRMRPEYIRRWLADPKSVLPYTAMPSHFPTTGEPLGQDIFSGSSREQLDAVTELLIRYDEYMKRQR
jgi:cytochrome c551/c552